MDFAQRIERPYRVRFDEAGPDGQLKASGFLRFAQDLAWIHSETGGFGRDWYSERGLTWLVRGIELDVLDGVEYGSEVVVSTEVIGFRRVWARRRSEFVPANGERPLGVAITDWVLLNSAGRPIRPPDEILGAFAPATTDFTPLKVAAEDPPGDAARLEFHVRRSELDPMAHVNNAVYLDYLDELYLAGGLGHTPAPRRYRAEFLASAEHGAALVGRGWDADDAWHYLLHDDADRALLRARLETDPTIWVGD